MLNVMRDSLNQSFTKVEANPLLYVLWGVFLLTLCAQLSIPLEPVPITLQTFGVMLVGLSFPRKIALSSVLTYLVMGAVGFPVFAEFKSGYAIFLGPTGGYLIGFLASVLVMTSIASKQKNPWSLLSLSVNCLLGTCTTFLFGIMGLLRFMDLHKAIQAGLLPFIIPGIIKIALLAISLKYLRKGLLNK